MNIVAILGDQDSAFAEQAIPALEAAHRLSPRNATVTGGLVRAYATAGSWDAAQALYDTDPFLKSDAEEAKGVARTLEIVGVTLAEADLKAGRVAQGKTKLEAVRASTKNAELATVIDQELARLEKVQAANHWVDRYNEGIKAVREQKLDRAVAIFEEVRKQSTDERLVFEAGRRLEEIKAFRVKTGR